MRDLDLLLDVIYANPDDDGARTVYADALLELGDVRGELIVAQLPGGNKARAKALLKEHGRSWLGPLAAITLQFEFERGFPAKLAIDVRREREIKRVAKDPRWTTVHTVELGGQRPDLGSKKSFSAYQMASVSALAKSPGFARREFRPSIEDIVRSEASRYVRRNS